VIKPLSNIADLGLILIPLTIISFSSTTSAEHKLANIEALPSQSLGLDFDMDFEHKNPLDNWSIAGDHGKDIIDTQTYCEGKQSLHLSTVNSLKKFPQSILSQTLYTGFERDYISLSGFIRYTKINDAGRFNVFLTTFDENNEKAISKYIEYKFMSTTDWQAFKITLPISQEVSYVNIGAVLNGQGRVWLDDFLISFPKSHKEKFQ